MSVTGYKHFIVIPSLPPVSHPHPVQCHKHVYEATMRTHNDLFIALAKSHVTTEFAVQKNSNKYHPVQIDFLFPFRTTNDAVILFPLYRILEFLL